MSLAAINLLVVVFPSPSTLFYAAKGELVNGCSERLFTGFAELDIFHLSACDTRLHDESEASVLQASVHACFQSSYASLATMGCKAEGNV